MTLVEWAREYEKQAMGGPLFDEQLLVELPGFLVLETGRGLHPTRGVRVSVLVQPDDIISKFHDAVLKMVDRRISEMRIS